MNIAVYNTRDAEEIQVLGVPSSSEEEAARMFCEKRGWRLVVTPASDGCDQIRYWGLALSPSGDISEEVANNIGLVQSGELDELRGLYQIYETDSVINWSEVK